MKSIRCRISVVAALLLVATLFRLTAADPPKAETPDFSGVTAAVLKLLETGNTAAFVDAMSPTLADWQAAQATNHVTPQSLARAHDELATNARQLLAKAVALKVEFSSLHPVIRSMPPRFVSNIRYEGMKEGLPYVDKLELVVTVAPPAIDPKTERWHGEYKLLLRGLMKFPAGWRCKDGLLWTAFPTNLVDEVTQREMNLLAKAASYKGITQAEDPALAKLGEAVARFIRDRDMKAFEAETLLSLDTIIAATQAAAATRGEKLPPRAAMEKQWKEYAKGIGKSVQGVLNVLDEGCVILKGADITVKAAEFKSLYPRGGPGTVEGLEGNGLRLTLTVNSTARSKTGQPVAGEYVLGAEEAVRHGGKWFISENLHWKKFPAGVLDEKILANVEFENYVAENNTLPPGTLAPDIEFVRMADKQKMKLADLRGKVVVLDFWATDCGPCQAPLAELQKLPAARPAWSNRVELVSLSIDRTLKLAFDHLEKRGWTNTFNVWAGPGGWKAGPPLQYRVTGIPTTYIIDASGKIVEAGHPVGMEIPQRVDELLAAAKP